MRLRNTNPTAVRSVPFTLVELLVVMLIMGILLAVTVPAVIKITSGSSVEAASRMVGSQLRLARQEAITRRKYVAVLFPRANLVDTSSPADANVALTGFRACVVDTGTYAFNSWIENSPWVFVPTGAVIPQVDGGSPTSPNFPEGSTAVVSFPAPNPWSITAPVSVRAVVFRPSGRLAGSLQLQVTIVEGAVAPGSATAILKTAANYFSIKINQYTGRVTFVRPGG